MYMHRVIAHPILQVLYTQVVYLHVHCIMQPTHTWISLNSGSSGGGVGYRKGRIGHLFLLDSLWDRGFPGEHRWVGGRERLLANCC